MFSRRAAIIAILIGLACQAAFAKRQTLKLKNGNEITGEVRKTDAGYRVRIGPGQVITIGADDVEAVVDVVTPEDEYKQRLGQIDPNDPAARYELGKWAFSKGYLKIAQKELKAAMGLRKDYEMAAILLRRVEDRLREPTTQTGEEGDGEEPAGGDGGGTDVTGPKLMGMADINRIRLYELGPNERVPVLLRNGVVQRFIESMRGKGDFRDSGFERQFLRYDNLRKAQYMLAELGKDNWGMKDDIVVRADPKFMIDYRNRIWPLVLQRCATNECHGGSEGKGSLKLFRSAARQTELHYTNLLVLDTYAKNTLRMIDRDMPDKSLLLNYLLPQKIAEFRHPADVNFPPAFQSREDALYKVVRDWVEALKGPPHHGYPVQYRPAPPGAVPGPGPTTRPGGPALTVPPGSPTEPGLFVPPAPTTLPVGGGM